MPPIPVNLAVEDTVSEIVIRKVLDFVNRDYWAKTIYNRGGFGYLKKNINGFNHAAKGIPFVVLTDLDRYKCPLELIEDWLSNPKNENLLFRVAVKEVEAWLLADREAIADFLGVRIDQVPENPESIEDPKKEIVKLACNSSKREIRTDVCPPKGSTRQVGPDYNGQLSEFVTRHWRPDIARTACISLARTIDRLASFNPSWAEN